MVDIRSPATIWQMCRRGDLDGVQQFAGAKGDLNESNKNGQTPLMYAAEEGFTDICRFLISKGALVNAVSLSGSTPLNLAALKGHADVTSLLINHGANVDFSIARLDAKRYTALSIAIIHDHPDICLLLLAAGADPDMKKVKDDRFSNTVFSTMIENSASRVLASWCVRQAALRALDAIDAPAMGVS